MKLSVSATGTACTDLHTAANGLLHIAPSGAGAAATANAPDGIAWGIAQKFGVGLIHTILAVDCVGRAWIEGYDGITWNGWRQLATATPPQEFALPLVEGASAISGYKNAYSKDQFGIVRVWFSVHFESIPEVNAPVFTLPEGFRPDSVCDNAATLSMGAHYPALLSISASGIAIVSHGDIEQAGAINLHGYIEFPAAS